MLLPLKQASAGHSSGKDRFLPRSLEGCGGFALLDMVIAIIILGAVAAFAAETLWSAGRSYAEMRSYRDGFHKAVNCMEALAVEFEKVDFTDFTKDNESKFFENDLSDICPGCSVSRTIAMQKVNNGAFIITEPNPTNSGDTTKSTNSGDTINKKSAAGRLIHVTVTPSGGAPSLTRLFGK